MIIIICSGVHVNNRRGQLKNVHHNSLDIPAATEGTLETT